MKCSKCENEIKSGEKFCKGCGAKTEYADLTYGKLVVTRKKSIFGCAIPFKIYIDEELKGRIQNGDTLSLEILYGTHKVSFNKPKYKLNILLTISDDKKSVKFTIKANLFALALIAQAKIIDVE